MWVLVGTNTHMPNRSYFRVLTLGDGLQTDQQKVEGQTLYQD